MRYFLLFFLGLVSFSGLALADCSNPEGPAGRQMYNSTYNVMQFCDGTLWQSMKGGGTLAGLDCADGELAKWNDGTATWICADQSSGGGGASCAGKSVTWGSCSASLPTTPDGLTEIATDPNTANCYHSDNYGSKAYGCKDGTWLEGSPTCLYAAQNSCN